MTDDGAVGPPSTGSPRWARLVTEGLAPAPMVALLLVAVASASTDSLAAALGWGLMSALFASALPFAYIVAGVRGRRLTDHHIGLREQRTVPLLVGILSVVGGLVLLQLLGAPRQLFALVVAMLAGLIATVLVTVVWKISVHSAVAAGTAVIVVQVFAVPALVVAPVVALVACARVASHDHTVAQVVAGAAMGATIAGLVFGALR